MRSEMREYALFETHCCNTVVTNATDLIVFKKANRHGSTDFELDGECPNCESDIPELEILSLI